MDTTKEIYHYFVFERMNIIVQVAINCCYHIPLNSVQISKRPYFLFRRRGQQVMTTSDRPI